MVQYIHTPWRDRSELLRVRAQFYPPNVTDPTRIILAVQAPEYDQQQSEIVDNKQRAVSRVSMWMQRGSCPHMVESTSLLTAAMLDDLREARNGNGSATSAVRLAYSAAFSRFVTGLLDSHQDKQQKQSMYSIAKTIRLPATFVELRHQCTHEQLPSLLKLRSAAEKSLIWIWDYYWKHLPEDESPSGRDTVGTDSCKTLLLSYLETDDAARRRTAEVRLRQWNEAEVLQTLSQIGDTAENPQILLRSVQLSEQIVEGGLASLGSSTLARTEDSVRTMDLDAIRTDISGAMDQLDNLEPVAAAAAATEGSIQGPKETKGWSRYQGPWKPKPIGVV